MFSRLKRLFGIPEKSEALEIDENPLVGDALEICCMMGGFEGFIGASGSASEIFVLVSSPECEAAKHAPSMFGARTVRVQVVEPPEIEDL